MNKKVETEVEKFSPVVRPQWLDKIQGKVSESEVSKDEIGRAEQDIENEPALAKNGWTPKTLAAYYKERELAGPTGRPPKIKPRRTNGWHNAHKWRKE